jgi:hypothetical protein
MKDWQIHTRKLGRKNSTQPYNIKTTKKDLIRRSQEHNIKKWKDDPVHQELYALATNPNRTAADDTRFYELRDFQRKRDFKLLQRTLSKREIMRSKT